MDVPSQYAPSHNVILIHEVFTKNLTNIASQPSPLRFESAESIKQKTEPDADGNSKKYFQNWIKRWRMCIANIWDYFEADRINLDE